MKLLQGVGTLILLYMISKVEVTNADERGLRWRSLQKQNDSILSKTEAYISSGK